MQAGVVWRYNWCSHIALDVPPFPVDASPSATAPSARVHTGYNSNKQHHTTEIVKCVPFHLRLPSITRKDAARTLVFSVQKMWRELRRY